MNPAQHSLAPWVNPHLTWSFFQMNPAWFLGLTLTWQGCSQIILVQLLGSTLSWLNSFFLWLNSFFANCFNCQNIQFFVHQIITITSSSPRPSLNHYPLLKRSLGWRGGRSSGSCSQVSNLIRIADFLSPTPLQTNICWMKLNQRQGGSLHLSTVQSGKGWYFKMSTGKQKRKATIKEYLPFPTYVNSFNTCAMSLRMGWEK